MKISWVVAMSTQQRPTADQIETMKKIAPIWGGVSTWRHWQTDHVVANTLNSGRWLLEREIQKSASVYVSQKLYQDLRRPDDVQLFNSFDNVEAKDLDDLIALNLASADSDIILGIGFDLSTPISTSDPVRDQLIRSRYGMLLSIMRELEHVQWVMIDHEDKFDPAFADLSNVTRDKIENVLKLLS